MSKIAGYILLGAGTIWGLFSISDLHFSEDLIEHTIQNNRKIESAFSDLATFMLRKKEETGEYPTGGEVTRWITLFNTQRRYLEHISILDSDFPEEAVEKFGPIPPGELMFSLWRGEWMEYYAPWSMQSTVAERSDYYIFGSLRRDLFATAIFSTVLMLTGITCLIFARKSKTKDGLQDSTST